MLMIAFACASATLFSTLPAFEISLKLPSAQPSASTSYVPLAIGNQSIEITYASIVIILDSYMKNKIDFINLQVLH